MRLYRAPIEGWLGVCCRQTSAIVPLILGFLAQPLKKKYIPALPFQGIQATTRTAKVLRTFRSAGPKRHGAVTKWPSLLVLSAVAHETRLHRSAMQLRLIAPGTQHRYDVQGVAVRLRMNRVDRRDKHDRPAAFPRGVVPFYRGCLVVRSSAGRAVIMSGHEAYGN